MLIDHVTLKIAAGTGGTGVVRWRREKGIPYGGPAGGDGGRGGDVYFRVIRDIAALLTYSHKKEWEADNGEAGQKRGMHGSYWWFGGWEKCHPEESHWLGKTR